MKKNIKILLRAAVLAITIGVVAQGCKKDDQSSLNPEKVSEIKSDKFQKILNFISISWGVQKDKIGYDPIKKEYAFSGILFSEEKMESIYDSSNEYKLKYEKN
jgi:hypothetical protein